MPARVRDALGIELEVTDFFRFPTLETLAGHIMDLQHGKSGPSESARGRSDTRVQGRERQLQRRIRSGNFA
ncbi:MULTISPECIES: acyl carrier protein [unclassified Rhizobium]|nr:MULTISPECIES: acyl carrier protein [unclassified Rhizobium]